MQDMIDELFVNKNKNLKKYKWSYAKKYFILLCDQLIESCEKNNIQKFIYYYYLFLFSYDNYVCFLFNLNKNVDEELGKIEKQIRNDKNIILFLINNKNNKQAKTLINYIYPFYSSTQTNPKNMEVYLKYYIDIQTKEYENAYSKIVELIIFRYINCKENNYENFHSFYKKKILNNKMNNNFKKFITILPQKHYFLKYNVKDETEENININIYDVIVYALNTIDKRIILNNKIKKTENSIIINIGNNIIEIIIDSTKIQSIICIQHNFNSMCENVKEIENMDFVKNKNKHVIINFNEWNITNYGLLLNIIHFITTSIKIIHSKYNNILEFNNKTVLTNYYYNSFYIFIHYLKNIIIDNKKYEKYLFELVKYLYIYSIYDYYFYIDNDLIKKMVSENKNNEIKIFLNFCCSIKEHFNIPINFINHPPFNVDIIEDIDQPIYYSYVQPNYYKFFDFINALIDVFNIKENINNFDDIILTFFNLNISPIQNIKPTTQTQKISKCDVRYTEFDGTNEFQLRV